jgi:hypothetical protein
MTDHIDMTALRRAARARKQRREWGNLVLDAARALETFGQAPTEDDDIMGVLSSEHLGNAFPALPLHIREMLADLLTDEANRSWRADRAYLEAQETVA